MIDRRILFQALRGPWTNAIELRIAARSGVERVSHVGEITFRPIEENTYSEPSIELRLDEAQTLMDELWTVGLRPSEGTGSAGSLAATERHLADMQRVAFGALKRVGVVD